MSEDSILSKLRAHVAQSMDREADVVYLLVEARKYLDRANDASYPDLRMFCNWAVHIELGNPTVQNFVTRVDEYLGRVLPGKPGIPPNDIHLFQTLLNLDGFRHELCGFLCQHSISTPFHNDANWASFLSLYARVVEDCALTCRAAAGTTRLIDRMVIKYASERHGSFPVDWILYRGDFHQATVHLPDGKLIGAILEWNGKPPTR
jgi:hypothetical protein